MTVSGIDIAWARPTVAQIKASGAHWAARYFSKDSSKNLHASEVTSYQAAGLGIVVVWETTSGRARAGRTAGVADAQVAEQQRKAVGLPADMVLHFAVDEDTTWASVAPYVAGVASVIGRDRTGVYGGYAVVEGAAAAGYRYLWQTVAWSGGRWSLHATIRQTGSTTLAGGADWDTATAPDFGQYPRPNAPTSEDDMPTAAEIAKAVWDADLIPAARPPHANADYAKNKTWQAKYALQTSVEGGRATAAQLTALSAAVKSLAGQLGMSPADVQTIVAAVQKAVAEATIHVTVSGPGPDPAKG